MVIKNIFDGSINDEVHSAFLKFGRGEYKNKYLLEGKRQAKKWAIKAGAEYSNFLVRRCLEKAGESVDVTGVIVSTQDLRDEVKFEIKKVGKFQGVRKIQIATSINVRDFLDFMDRFPRAFFALSFKTGNIVLKIKPKGPTSGKPGKEKDEGPKADFCSLKTDDKDIVEELFFGVGDFSEVRISHTIEVNDIVYPANVEELKPAEVREMAKRKGVIKRIVNADGIVKTSEAEFVA